MPSIPITVFTDDVSTDNILPYVNIKSHPCPKYTYRDKISILENSPYYYTLFLDTDATPLVDISSTFNLLQSFDIAASYAPVRIPRGWYDDDVPEYFPELNTGVIFFRNSNLNRRLFRAWCSLYDFLSNSFSQLWDQASFRSVLWKYYFNRQTRLHLLPPEYNFRLTKPWIAGKGLPVSILHGRVADNEWEPLKRFLNSDINTFRTYIDWYNLYPQSLIRIKPGFTSK